MAIEWYSMEILKLPVQPGAKVDQASRVLRAGHGCLTYSNAIICGSATVLLFNLQQGGGNAMVCASVEPPV